MAAINNFMGVEILARYGSLRIVCDNARINRVSSRKRGRQSKQIVCPALAPNSRDRWSPVAGKSFRKQSTDSSTTTTRETQGLGFKDDEAATQEEGGSLNMTCRWEALVQSEKDQECTMRNCLPARHGPLTPPPPPSPPAPQQCLADFKFSGVSSLKSLKSNRPSERRGSKDSMDSMLSIDTVLEILSLSSLESEDFQPVHTAPRQYSDIARVA
jgi:hypothetical protein